MRRLRKEGPASSPAQDRILPLPYRKRYTALTMCVSPLADIVETTLADDYVVILEPGIPKPTLYVDVNSSFEDRLHALHDAMRELIFGEGAARYAEPIRRLRAVS